MKIAFPTDEHIPFQDDRARQVALKIVEAFSPDILFSGSDALDFYAVSKFDKDPTRIKAGLQDEIDEWAQIQYEWADAAPKARRIFIVGNHEDRMRKYLWSHPELSSLDVLALPALLGLAELGIEWDYQGRNTEYVIENTLVVKHGRFVRSASALSAKAEAESERYSISVLSGHTHRGGTYYSRTRSGVITSVEGFCLCSLDPEYVDRPDWQQGIVLAEVKNGTVAFEPVLISDAGNKKVARWRGKEYSA